MAHDLRLTRRDVLQRAGAVVAAAAFPPGAPLAAVQGGGALAPGQTNADLPISEIMTRLSTYMSQARDRALPDDVLEKAKWHVLDTIAAMVSGSELTPGRAAIAFARAYGGKEVATVVGDTIVCGPIEAALVNGTMAHADETDDTLAGPWHPGCNVVPAALALGEQFGTSGTHFVRAVVLGYDVGTRLLAAILPGLANSHKLSYGIGGVFGAAAAAGCAASLNAQQMRWLISYTAQQSSGIESFPRDLDHRKRASSSPAWGAQRRHVGLVGPCRLECGERHPVGARQLPERQRGQGQRRCGRRKARRALRRDAHEHQALDRGATDPRPARRGRGAPQAAAHRSDQIQEIVVRYAPGSITDNSGPSDINVQHALAVMLVDKTVTFRSIHDKARMQDPVIVGLRGKVRLEPGGGAARARDRRCCRSRWRTARG